MSYRQGYRPPAKQAQTRATSQRKTASTSTRKAPVRKAPARKAKSRRRKNRPIRIFLLLTVCAFFATAGVMVYTVYDEVNSVEKLGTFYPGVYIDGVELYGRSPQEAYDMLVAKSQSGLENWAIELKYGDNTWRIDTNTLGMSGAISEVVRDEVNKAFFIGRTSSSIVDRYQTIVELKTEPYVSYTTGIQKDTSRIDSIISEIQAAVYRAPKDASLAFDATRKNNAVIVTNEEYGQDVDAVALKSQIINMINNMEAGTIQIEPRMVEPALKAAMLSNELGLLGSYETAISSRSTEFRNLNVERGCYAFHGKVVKAGETVSFNKWVGERTEKNGFYPAEEIVSGSYEMGVGGGICQVSSTLYNAVIKAGLEVVSRRNHAIPVNYMEMGADATVSDGRIDFVFKNNTGSDIYMIARVDTSSSGKKSCVVQIYGKPSTTGYTYSLRHTTIEEIPVPEPVRTKDTKATHVVYTDEEYQATKGAKGYRVDTYLVVRNANGSVVEEKFLYTDEYKAQAPVVYVGVNKRPDF